MATFSMAGCAVALTCHAASDRAWLEANLRPSFAAGSPHDHCVRVTFVRDGAAHARLSRGGPVAGREPVPCFAMDGGVVAHPKWRGAGGGTIIRDGEFDVFYRVADDGAGIRVVAPRGRPWARVATLRVVREVLSGALRRGGGAVLHAAGFCVGARGILLAGPKGAGKTSLLAHALSDPRTALLANDRSAIRPSAQGYLVQGVPTIVHVRVGTFERLGLEPMEDSLVPACDGPAEGRRGAGMPTRSPGGGLVMSPAQFAAALGTSRSGGASVAAILFPRIHDGPGGIVLRRLEVGGAIGLLEAARPFAGATIFAGRDGADPAPMAALAAAVPCLRCDIGADAYRTIEPARLVDWILDHVRPKRRAEARGSSATAVVIPDPPSPDAPGEQPRWLVASPDAAARVVGRASVRDAHDAVRVAGEGVRVVPANDAGRVVLAAAAGRGVAFLPAPSPAALEAARDLDPTAPEIMPLASTIALSTGRFVDARDVPLGWALSAPAAERLLPGLGAPEGWSLARLYADSRAQSGAFRWRSGPVRGAPAPPAAGGAALGRRSRVVAIVPHFACESWLAEALESLAKQSRPPDAIAVIDDASEAPPREICGAFPGVTLYRSPTNVGPYRLVHSLLAATDFDAVLFQDADDWSMADRLAMLLAEAERTGAELLGTQELRLGDADRRFQVATYPADVEAACRDHPHHTLLHPTSLLATGLLERLGGLAAGLRYSGDTELLFRAVFAARVVNVPALGYVRRDRPGSLTTAPSTGLASSQRTALLHRLAERGRRNAERRRIGLAPDLSPYATAEPVPLRRLVGPEIRTGRPRRGPVPARTEQPLPVARSA